MVCGKQVINNETDLGNEGVAGRRHCDTVTLYKMPGLDKLVKQTDQPSCVVIQNTSSVIHKGVTIVILESVHCQPRLFVFFSFSFDQMQLASCANNVWCCGKE